MNNQNNTSSAGLLIEMEDIAINLGGKFLFEQTRWTLDAGQHWAIHGPNGSGKTVFIHALCKKIPIEQGRIRYFFDRNDSGQPFYRRGEMIIISTDAQKDIMVQYGGYHQSRWHSFEAVDVPAVADFLSGTSIEHVSPYEVTPLRIDEELYRDRRDAAVELLQIGHLFTRKINQLSNGEARKVLLVRALMQSPKVLILDDPFGGLDNVSRELLRHLMERVIAGGVTQLILTTTRIEEIPQSVTHLMMMEKCRITAQGLKDIILKSESWQRSVKCLKTPEISRLTIPDYPMIPATGGPVLVEMIDTSISYAGVQVLSNIDWTVKQGERWAVLGHNGAGKTTLLSLILADNPQGYANRIRLFGKQRGSGESIWDIKKHIGWVSPELQIFSCGGLTCLDTVCSGFFDTAGLYRDCSAAQTETAAGWLQAFGLGELADRLFGTISVSEQRMVLLARALVKRPVLLILDELCQGLDFIHRQYIMDLLDLLCEQTSISMIYITHYFDELPKAITNVLKLEKGRVVENVNMTVNRT